MIIVEGPDGAGKTTLVKDLAVRFNLKVGERGVSDRDFLWKVTVPDTFKAICRAATGHIPPHIWDRLFFSEFVYAPVTGRVPQFSTAQTVWIAGLLEYMEVPIILCMPPRDVCYRNAGKAHQMEGVEDRFTHIYDGYRDLSLPRNTTHYDYVSQSPQEVYLAVDNYLKRRRRREW